MKLIDRYIISHILGMTAITALALLAIQTFIAYIAEIDEVGQGDFGYLALAQYILLQVPVGLHTLLPIIAMLGTMLGLGVLAGQGELTAMRASGVSLLRLGSATLGAGLLLATLSVALGDWLGPGGQQRAEAMKSELRYGVTPGVGGRTVWLREGQDYFRIQRLVDQHHVEEMTIYSMNEDLSLRQITAVARGHHEDGLWQFEDVQSTALNDTGATVGRQASMQWQGLSPEVLELFVLESRSLSALGLLQLIDYLEANDLDALNQRLSLWRKLVAPITVMVMMLLAVPFVLGPLRDSGAGQRLLVGIMIGLGFYLCNEVSASIGQLYQWPAPVSAAAPTLVVAVIAFWRLAQSR